MDRTTVVTDMYQGYLDAHDLVTVPGVAKLGPDALIGPDAKVLDVLSRLPAGVYQRGLIAGGRRRR